MAEGAPDRAYLDTLLLYYEEEIEGEAYFEALAARLADPAHKYKMQLLAEVEAYAAHAVRPLIEAYGLRPRPASELRASGDAQAAEGSAGWDGLIAEMRETFPGYVADFERLEAMAPPEDRAVLKVLTAHEVAAISFLEREAAGDPDSTAPLRRYLETGAA